MSEYKFSAAERMTVFNADGGKCFWCGLVLVFTDVQIDHFFPERLAKAPEEFAAVQKEFGLPGFFKLNGFENWVTCHQGCNLRKSGGTVLNAPLALMLIKGLLSRAPSMQQYHDKLKADVKRGKILGMLMSAIEAKSITKEDVDALFEGLPALQMAAPADAPVTLHVAPGWEVVVPNSPAASIHLQGWQVVRVSGNIADVTDGRVGGVVPNVEKPDPSWRCSQCCNYGPWDGIICRSCGNREEPD